MIEINLLSLQLDQGGLDLHFHHCHPKVVKTNADQIRSQRIHKKWLIWNEWIFCLSHSYHRSHDTFWSGLANGTSLALYVWRKYIFEKVRTLHLETTFILTILAFVFHRILQCTGKNCRHNVTKHSIVINKSKGGNDPFSNKATGSVNDYSVHVFKNDFDLFWGFKST